MQIHYHAARGDINAVKQALHYGSQIDDLLDKFGTSKSMTPLMFAACSPFAGTDMVRFLVKNGADVNAIGGVPERTPLSLATNSGSIEKTRFLLASGANVNLQFAKDYTALIHAAYTKSHKARKRLFEILLNAKANPNVITSYGESALSVAAYFADFASIGVLHQFGGDLNILKWTPIMQAIALGSVEDVANRLAELQGDEVIDRWNLTPWLLSLAVGDVRKSKLLRENGYTLQEQDIIWAIRKDNANMVRWLLSLGANPNAVDSYGDTVLMSASEFGSTKCVRVLIDAGADIDARNNVNSKAIDLARNSEIAKVLLEAGADINFVNGQGYTLLKNASEDGDLAMVTDLLALGADPNVSSTGETPLYVAVRADHHAIVKSLLDAGANPNIRTVDDWYPLQNVKTVETAKLLLEAGADAAYTNWFGRTPADHHNDPTLVSILRQAQQSALRKRAKSRKRSKK